MLTVLSSHVTSVASRKKNLPAEKKPPIHRPPGGHPTTTSGRSGHAVTRWEAGDGGDGWKQDPKENSNLSVLFSFFFNWLSAFLVVSPTGGTRGHIKSHRGDFWRKSNKILPTRGVWETWPQRRSFSSTHTHTHRHGNNTDNNSNNTDCVLNDPIKR